MWTKCVSGTYYFLRGIQRALIGSLRAKSERYHRAGGYGTARQVGLIMLAKVQAALGSLDRVKRVVKVLGMVNSPEGFGDQPRVVNGFSDLMVEVFGEQIGKHARSAVGMEALPSNSAVEVEMIVEVE